MGTRTLYLSVVANDEEGGNFLSAALEVMENRYPLQTNRIPLNTRAGLVSAAKEIFELMDKADATVIDPELAIYFMEAAIECHKEIGKLAVSAEPFIVPDEHVGKVWYDSRTLPANRECVIDHGHLGTDKTKRLVFNAFSLQLYLADQEYLMTADEAAFAIALIKVLGGVR